MVQRPVKTSGPLIGSASAGCDDIISTLDASECVDSTALDDESSPQHHAMYWICKHDPAKLDLDDPGFLTRYALAVLFYGTSGRLPADTGVEETDWINHDYWLTGVGYCSWFGITCVDEEGNLELNANGEILQIELSQNILSGSLPPELSALSDAFGFHLDSNFLHGSIPSHFGLLTNLRDLWLSDNKLSGSIPRELGNMEELRELTLGKNDLTGRIPETISQATHLHYFAMAGNHLIGTVPSAIFATLTALKTFHASDNELTGRIPEELYGMTTLSALRLSENELSGTLSEKLGQLIYLERLHLSGNRFNGEIPDTFLGMDLLTECRLGHNDFNGVIPVSLGESLALVELTLEDNALTGNVSDEVCTLTEIGSLEVLTADCYSGVNSIEGTLDPSNIESTRVVEGRGELGRMTSKEKRDNVVCDCCTECF
ncbi:unnamed protein product [Cylindrotheca closterium]|uniref:L domain-like protein n=1 Tax=Cylindrotheca closterium TaxID=2856 RepID=A0AAD2G168_9STRA|nr:unnamed protein product [Cylindrotheca closterium]